jgi:hypothetical protein
MAAQTRHAILALLANGPSSFAALHGFVVREGSAPADVDVIWAELNDLERASLVRARRLTPEGVFEAPTPDWRQSALLEYRNWLTGLRPDELPPESVAVDEVGLWYVLTNEGGAKTLEEPAAWSVDVDDVSGTVVVHAADDAAARRGLAEWLATSGDIIDADQIRVRPAESFAVRLVAVRRERSSRPPRA